MACFAIWHFFVILVVAWLFLIFRLIKNTSNKKERTKGIFDKLRNRKENAKIKKLQKEKDELIKKSITDALTGVYNRMGLMECSKTMLREAKKKRKNIYVCSIDLNGLKHINDTYGHMLGGSILKKWTR